MPVRKHRDFPNSDWVVVTDGLKKYSIATWNEDEWEFFHTNSDFSDCPCDGDGFSEIASDKIYAWLDIWDGIPKKE